MGELSGSEMQAWISERIIHVGAEAEVSLGTYLGQPAVEKIRRPRLWRHPELDARLTRRRMMAEARLLTKLARAGLPVPLIQDFDIASCRLIMTLIPGRPLIEHLRDSNSVHSAESVLVETGELVRRLHRQGITHGDLSTNNFLYCPVRGASLIDFGLARITEEVEDFGIDLHVLHEILGASHPEHSEAMEWIIEGYLSFDGDQGPPPAVGGGPLPSAEEVVARLKDIMTRVRYHG